MNKLAQSVVSSMVLFVFIIVGIIIIAFLSVVTTPLLQSFVTMNNLTGGFALIVNHFNLILIGILMISGLLIIVGGSEQ